MHAKPIQSIVMVAGEASGDAHAAHLIEELQRCCGPVFVCGMGGPRMRDAGARVLIDAHQVAVVGITEVLSKAPQVLKAMARLKKLLTGLNPDLLILIDFPDFNLHLAAIAKKLGIPVLYYISPQIWAWRAGRVKKIKARVDHMAVILPFEETFYREHGVPVSFVGHPIMDSPTGRVPIRNCAPPGSSPVVALLAGSRDREVSTLLPVMLKAAERLQQKNASLRLVISCASSIDLDLVHDILARHPVKNAEITTEAVSDLLPLCDLAIVASGTVTLETAICGIPMIITYTVSPVSYWLGRALIDVAHIGLVNLIAEKRIMPELIQKECSPETISDTAMEILSDPDRYMSMCQALLSVRKKLGQPGASRQVAQIAQALMGGIDDF
jgi:lipid-A-disaccharide synthase